MLHSARGRAMGEPGSGHGGAIGGRMFFTVSALPNLVGKRDMTGGMAQANLGTTTLGATAFATRAALVAPITLSTAQDNADFGSHRAISDHLAAD